MPGVRRAIIEGGGCGISMWMVGEVGCVGCGSAAG